MGCVICPEMGSKKLLGFKKKYYFYFGIVSLSMLNKLLVYEITNG